jgi:cob(I)alamin adenosyltransferase
VKIYTRTGDDGTTGLLGPGRVLKSDPRVEAYGTVDELNALVGAVRALDARGWFTRELESIQSTLFEVGAALATSHSGLAEVPGAGDASVSALEAAIDALEAGLPPLQRFILPGGTPLAAQLHVARTVCRRAERRVVALGESFPATATVVRYLNRLSDLLFVMARASNRRAGVTETEWQPPANRS